MDRRQEILRVYHEVRRRDPRDRDAFLADSCARDPELRREVESLLAAAEDEPDHAGGQQRATSTSVASATFPFPADRLAHYRILGKLGAGGMGEVYRARDEQLNRDVAIKVLPAVSVDDEAARARLVREARAAAALNHPHICTVHEVGEAAGRAYIAMELVEGQTLDARLRAGPLPFDEVMRYGGQLADALAHAHERGIVHRDLKSANVIVTPNGRLKVLDFGLAKRLTSNELTQVGTEFDATFTQPGTIMGTLAYMSPEQLRGQPTQAASDVWALGVVLYEMASALRPFQGQTAFELSDAILNDRPRSLPSSIQPALQSVISRCLEKEPGERYKSGGEVRAALDVMLMGGAGSGVAEMPPAPITERTQPVVTVTVSRRRVIGIGVAAVILAALGLATWKWLPVTADVRTLAVLPFENRLKDEDLEYLCEGIAESLIKQTSGLRMLKVSNLAAVLGLKPESADPAAAGRQLGAETVLAGTLEREGSRLLISARLVDVASGRQLWTNKYDRDAADLLDVRDEIASAIMSDGLRVQLSSAERQQLVRHPTTDGDAYDLFLQARYVQRRATEEDYLLALELLQRAIVRDQKFALAYAAVAATYAMMVTDGLVRPTDAWPQVNKYARQALTIDPSLPEALVMEAAVAFFFDWDWPGTERARRKFLESPVGDFDPAYLRAMSAELWALGRLDEALQLARRTRELDPRSPYLAILEADYLLRAGRFDQAVALYQYALGAEPDNLNGYFGLAEALYRQKRFEEAVAARRKAHEVAGDDSLKNVLAAARGEQGYHQIEQAWVRQQIDALKTRQATGYVSPLDFARAHAQIGENELAFKYLEESFADRSPGLVFLKVDRVWDGVRNDPRFQAAVKRVGLP